MSILNPTVDNLSAPRVIVCEGIGDVHLVHRLLKHHNLVDCQVGCPSNVSVGGMGKAKIADYLLTISAAATLKKIQMAGILVLGDADTSNEAAFRELSNALATADLPRPREPYVIETFQIDGRAVQIGVFIVPGRGKNGTLEHLLLECVDERKKECVDRFLECIGAPEDLSENELAKMEDVVYRGRLVPKKPMDICCVHLERSI